MDIPTLPELVTRMTRSNFPNENETDIDIAASIVVSAMTPNHTPDQVFHLCFKWATEVESPLIRRWYMMAVAVSSGIRQLSDEDWDFLAACRNSESKPETETESDLRLKRCLTCNGMFDTPGDYCPRCQSAISEDEGVADLDLYA